MLSIFYIYVKLFTEFCLCKRYKYYASVFKAYVCLYKEAILLYFLLNKYQNATNVLLANFNT